MNTAEPDLLARAAALPERIDPERDLWPEIEAALDDRSDHPAGTGPRPGRLNATPRWVVRSTLAASVVLAAAVGFWTGVGAGRADRVPLQISADLSEPSGAAPVQMTFDADLYQTRTLLVAEIEAELLRLPEDARNVVTENLAAIRRALDEIDAVLGQTPHTELDQQLLMTMYADQLALLSSMHSVIRTSSKEILL